MVAVRARRFQVIAIVLLSCAVIAQAVPPENDAGTSTDAGDSKATATPLSAFGSYNGTLRTHDEDWYSVIPASSVTSPVCIVADSSGTTYSNVTLDVATTSSEHSVTAPLPANGSTRIAVAGTSATATYYGIVPVPNPANNDPARPGTYGFTLTAYQPADLGPGDAGTGTDAGAWPNAIPLANVCIAGSLMPLQGIGDTVDAYSFAGQAGEQIVYTLGTASSTLRVSILNGVGTTLPGSTIATGQIGNITLPSDGGYYVSASQSDGTGAVPYVVGFLGGDPIGNPCRPTCAVV